MDFYQIKERSTRNGTIELFPDFKVCRSKDLMIRGKSFYAVWDQQKGIWSTDEYDIQRLVDEDLLAYREKMVKRTNGSVQVKLMSDFSSNTWTDFRNYMNHISDNAHQLDNKLTFSEEKVKKTDYVSKRLSYPLSKGPCDSFLEIVNTLYSEEERDKIIWSIGAVVSGDSRTIQKFMVFYGEAGAGKSTILNIIQKLFAGYYTTFEAKALTSSSNAFSTEVFKQNPLVGIQHDGDLSKIEDNTKLNSIVSHEEMTMNEKYKPSYTARTNCFLFMATNRPVKITDAKSGIIRRLIDITPSGKKIPAKRYYALMAQIDFELGAIANYCLEEYRALGGKNYYNSYRPLHMILQTDVFYNFVESNYYIFNEEGVSLKRAYDMYKTYCEEALIDFKLPRHKFREEFKNYFSKFEDVTRIDGVQIRSYYSGFLSEKFKSITQEAKKEAPCALTLDYTTSIFDQVCQDCPAQYATVKETPMKAWSKVVGKLKQIDTTKLHYVKVPLNHIVIDFDLKEDGKKSMEKNLNAANKFPPTYAEFSKSGNGIHLHYIYDGDVSKLSRVYDDEIEIKVFNGKSSLRRQLSKCNNIPIKTINSGLPLKGETPMINFDAVKSEKALRTLIIKNLNKEIHPGTAPSIAFIKKLLDDQYASHTVYNVTDMRSAILGFASNSTNQAEKCLEDVSKMHFASENELDNKENYKDDSLVFFDVEVFPNLFIVVWKIAGKDPVKMINPTPKEIEDLINMKLIGFNCRRYDNHILYARYLGSDNLALYNLSQKIVNNQPNCTYSEAYGLSYADIYDFSSKKQSLKKFEIDLGIHHQELGLPWDKEVPKELWAKVADYCVNDVVATEATFDFCKQDYIARQILADLSGLTVNDTTRAHTSKIIFGENKHPQNEFIYTDLSDMFPGYKYDFGKSTYKGEVTGEGGYVYAEPGMYGNVALLDIASMHPNSLINMNMFGPYTKNYEALLKARLAIKHKDFDSAKKMFDGRLAKFLGTEDEAKELAFALKIVINIVYGFTSAKFDNSFKDPRNVDNIVAKRGALFMINLKEEVKKKGFNVAHIKTDSIKIPDATPEIIDWVIEYGKAYGYNFEHEATYDKMCLVNNSVYIARMADTMKWTATGAQFATPYVFKMLFSNEIIVFEDMPITKSVKTTLYLDMNEDLKEDEHDYYFVGKVGSFVPVEKGGGVLLREKEGKYYAATGTKGYRWLETEMVRILKQEQNVDKKFYTALVDDAITNISKYGDFEWFISEEKYNDEFKEESNNGKE